VTSAVVTAAVAAQAMRRRIDRDLGCERLASMRGVPPELV
jgi:hypothetical protein